MQMDTNILRAIDRCLSLRMPFFAICDERGVKFGACADASVGRASLPDGESFFIGRFNHPWVGNVWIPAQLTAEESMDVDYFPASSGGVEALPVSTAKDQYLCSLSSVISKLKERGTAKTVVSIVSERNLPEASVSEMFANLAVNSAGCFAYVCYHPEVGCWMGAPPEVLVKAYADGHFETMALAGTLPVDADEWDEKNAEEHQIVVDYIMDRLRAIGVEAEKGQRQSLAYGCIKHLHTPIRGQLGQHSPMEVFDALNPTPALCGYPKEEALADIAGAEAHERGCYGGCVGLADGDSVRAYVNIRCCRLIDGRAYCYGGGGITPASLPEAEWIEANSKIDNFLIRISQP